MLGHSHALSGAVAGLATGRAALRPGPGRSHHGPSSHPSRRAPGRAEPKGPSRDFPPRPLRLGADRTQCEDGIKARSGRCGGG